MTQAGSTGVLPLALTMGDPAGIGPEIALKAWLARTPERLAPFCFYGSAEALRLRAEALGFAVPMTVIDDPQQAVALFASALPIIDIPLVVPAIACLLYTSPSPRD